MGRVLQFPFHQLAGVDVPCGCNPQSDYGCFICEGGLALCVVCGGAEGSMPTDCPGTIMYAEVADAVQAGELDYDRYDGWVQRPSGLATFIRRDAPRLLHGTGAIDGDS